MLVVAWDIDGTLLSPSTNTVEAHKQALARLGIVAPPEVVLNGRTDAGIAESYVQVCGLDVSPDVVRDTIEQVVVSFAKEFPPTAAPGVHTALMATAASGAANGLCTGNTPAKAYAKLNAAGLNTTDSLSGQPRFDPDYCVFGDVDVHRTGMTRRLANILKNTGHTGLVVGDTPSDALAAFSAGIDFCGVATGAFSTDALLACPNRLVVPDLVSGLEAFQELLDSMS